ncbi:MAG: hypothetical protein GY940_35710, partial [bacterium]|nr:hypothetical protein [bacterium]
TGPYKPAIDQFEGKTNLLVDINADTVTPAWKTKGEIAVETEKGDDGDNYIFAVRYGGYFWQNASVQESTGRYALLISYASSERVQSGDQTGLPYLYGYMLDKDNPNKINSYINKGREMKLSTQSPNKWGLIWGIVEIPPNTGGIRFFMQQADGRKPQNGSAARFDAPGIFIFDSEAEA